MSLVGALTQVSWGRDGTGFLFVVANTVWRRQEAVSTVMAAKGTHFNQRDPEQAHRPGQSLFLDPHPRKSGVRGATLTPCPHVHVWATPDKHDNGSFH